MRRGRQRRVPSPGQNRKVTVFGAVGFGRGSFLYHLQPRKTAWGFRALLHLLVTRTKRTRRRIVLILDQGNPHHAHVVHRDLDQARPHIQALWLPHYSPELNLIEMLWRHLKRTRLANVLFSGYEDLRNHIQRTLTQFVTEPDFTLGILKQPPTTPIRRNLSGVT